MEKLVFGKSKRTTPTNQESEGIIKSTIGALKFTTSQGGKKMKFPMANVKTTLNRSMKKQ